MIKTSAAYQAAIVGSPRRIEILSVVDISDPDMVYGEVLMDSQAPWSKPAELHNKEFSAPARYATLEHNRWLLDGSFDVFPDDYQVAQPMGVCNDMLSGEDGAFTTPAYVAMTFSQVDVLQAFSLFFSTDPMDGVPTDFTVEVLSADQVFYSSTVVGNAETELSFSGFTVFIPDTIRVTVTRWSLPRRRLRMVEIVPGIFEQWTGRALVSFVCNMTGDFSCLSLPYGTVDVVLDNRDRRFEPRKKGSLFRSIEERQGMEVYIGVRLSDGAYERVKLGVFYQAGDGWKTSTNDPTIAWSMVDIVGLLADRTYLPPDVLPTTLEGWIASVVAQLGTNFTKRYVVDPAYGQKPVTANSLDDVTGKKCGDIIRWACMATGTWPRADQETGYLAAEPLWQQGNKYTLRSFTKYPTMQANKSIASLIFTLADSSKTQYVVSGNQTSSEETVSIQNPFLHTKDQALAAARLILSCYGGNLFETVGRGDPSSEIGDVDTLWLDESTASTARRTMQSFNISGGVLQGCQSRGIQADGSYLYEAFNLITESGSWTAPSGVTRLRLVLGQAGQGGGYGEDGYVGGSGILPGSGVDAGYGDPGPDGKGGLVWYGVIDINPGQTFDVQIGSGGAPATVKGQPGAEGGHTTFGVYSSANGEYYPLGYTDIANGTSYARTGVPDPVDGSGDGAKGGDGGEPGAGYWEQLFWPDGRPRGWDFVVTQQPGEGKPGKRGADGFALISWDKGEET